MQMTKKLFLFVPATRLDRVTKAVDSNPDAIIIDLEDAVSKTQKQAVRTDLLKFDKQFQGGYWLRINAYDTSDFQNDVLMMSQLTKVQGVFLPKCQFAHEVENLYQKVKLPIIAMIETPKGLANIANIAQASGLYTFSYGQLDLIKSLGLSLHSNAAKQMLDTIRGQLLIYTKANDLCSPIETVFIDFKDDAGLRRFVHHWCEFGFSGQLLIHPAQVAIARQASIMSQEARQFAEKVWQTYQSNKQAVFAVDGKMVDLPIIQWAAECLGYEFTKI